MIRIRITGDDEIVGRLQALDRAGTRIMKRAIRLAVQPVIDDAKQRVRPVSPTIADAIDVEQKLRNKGQYHYLRIGAEVGDAATSLKPRLNPLTGLLVARRHKPSKTQHLVEGGTKPHRMKLFGKIRIMHPGARPHPHLVPALESNADLVEATFAREASMGIERELNKRAKRAKRIQRKADAILKAGET